MADIRKAIEALKDWRCEVIHGGFYWPSRGTTKCRTCHRIHPLKAVR